MKFKLFIILIILCVSLPVADAWPAGPETDYQRARDAYYALKNSARKQMYRDQWEKVIALFDEVRQRYPGSDRGADAFFMCGKTTAELYTVSRMRRDAEDAVALFKRMAERYPDSSLADDALLEAGRILEEDLGEPTQSYVVYQTLVSSFPKGDMASAAESRMAALAAHAPRDNKPDVAPSRPPPAADAAQPRDSRDSRTALTGIRYWSNPGYTRIVLDLSQETEFSAHFLAPDGKSDIPPRIYVDLAPAELSAALKEPTIVDDGLLQQIRTGTPQAGTVRVVLDLVSIGDYKVFPLGDPYRLVIDVAGQQEPELKRREPEIHALPDGGKDDEIAKVLEGVPKESPALHIPATRASGTLRRIVVDAGHGGKDPGAVGPGGTFEKDVTLAFAKELSKALRKELGCEVVLTRSGDVYLPLEERTAIANKVGADLFISLHANANNSRQAYGIETYYLNFSKNDKAAAVAARENGTSIKQVSDLELILFDLMANSKINESSRLAAEIQKSLVNRLDRHYRNIRNLGVRQGPFYVLLGATMPSVLVETAFISNPREEKRLTSRKYQQHAAEAIADAVKSYAIANRLIASK